MTLRSEHKEVSYQEERNNELQLQELWFLTPTSSCWMRPHQLLTLTVKGSVCLPSWRFWQIWYPFLDWCIHSKQN